MGTHNLSVTSAEEFKTNKQTNKNTFVQSKLLLHHCHTLVWQGKVFQGHLRSSPHRLPLRRPLLLGPVSQATRYGGDEGGSLPAAVFRLQECHLALRRQFAQRLAHDGGETVERQECVQWPAQQEKREKRGRKSLSVSKHSERRDNVMENWNL